MVYTHTHTHRKQKQQLWEKSCQWIATHESRVRVENRRMAGEDFQVWRWIQVRGEESGRREGEREELGRGVGDHGV